MVARPLVLDVRESKIVPQSGERVTSLGLLTKGVHQTLARKHTGHYLLRGQLRPHHLLCPKVSFLPGLIVAHS